MIRFFRSHAIGGYVALAFGVSYLIGVPVLLLAPRWLPALPGPSMLYLPRLFVVLGPAVAAVVLTTIFFGSQGVRTLLHRLLPKAADLPWVAIVLLVGIASAVAALLYAGIPSLILAETFRSNVLLLLAHLAFQTLLIGVGEELGWRGWLLPRLLENTSRLHATLATAGVWAVWHAPILASGVRTASFFLLGIVGLSILFTWLWERTNRRLFVVVLAHAVVNTPIFFWEQVSPGTEGGSAQLLRGWYVLEAGYAAMGAVLLLFTYPWWVAKSPAGNAQRLVNSAA